MDPISYLQNLTHAGLVSERAADVATLMGEAFTELLIPVIELTIPLAAVSFALGLALAVVLALVRIKNVPVATTLAGFFIWFVRGTPMLVQLFIVFFGLPGLGLTVDPIPSAILVFTANVGAYASEILRGAIGAVPKGQWAAGRSLGLTEADVMRLIVLPQAMRTAFPALVNTLLGLIKDTSLASAVTVVEMFMAAQLAAARTFEPFWLYMEAAFIYLMISTVVAAAGAALEKRLALPGR